MDHQQPYSYMRPPPPHAPPTTEDPYQRPSPLPPPPPPPGHHPWPYSTTQFQYPNQHSPSPPPSQWVPPPNSSQYAPPPPPYPAHPHYAHPLPPRPPHVPQSYAQDWGNGCWSHHQSWDYTTSNHEEDWAAKARAWAASKVSTDPPPLPGARPEEQNHYSQSVNPQYLDGHVPLASPSSYQQYPVGTGPPDRPGVGQSLEARYINSVQLPNTAEMHAPYAARDGSPTGDSSISPVAHQQEVPSSYSSVSGSEEAGDRYEKFNRFSSLPVASMPHHHPQPLPPPPDLSNQPLNFAPHFNRDHARPNYTLSSGGHIIGVEPNVHISSNYSWTPSSAPGGAYPPLSPAMPQVDHPIVVPSGPNFPTGHGFQPAVPITGASFAYGASSVAERPKKASVPNWLREEIIKNKAVITNSAMGLPKEDSQPVEENNNDSKSVDSSRSTEDEDEDEDEVEAAKTAAINQEIKRILTEVLLKVTDELFDEIATKVLNEDNLSVEVGENIDLPNSQALPFAPSISTPKASARVLIPTKTEKTDFEDASEKSTCGPTGDILGLASYDSDEEDDETKISGKLNSKESVTHQESPSNKLLEEKKPVENGDSAEETEEQSKIPSNLEHEKSSTEKAVEKKEKPDVNFDVKKSKSDDSGSHGNSLDKNDRHERANKIADDHIKHEERNGRIERTEHRNGSKDKGKEEKGRMSEKAKEISESKRDKRTSGKEADEEKRQERTRDEKKERSRNKNESGSTRYANDSSDDLSDDSRRKSHRLRRHKSPSPIRSRKRQVSRSPHSKHTTKRSHAPYTSVETKRGRRSDSRSRSRSPVHRRR